MTVERTTHRSEVVNEYACQCNICDRMIRVRSKGTIKHCLATLRKKGWRRKFIAFWCGSHDHCNECIDARKSTKRHK